MVGDKGDELMRDEEEFESTTQHDTAKEVVELDKSSLEELARIGEFDEELCDRKRMAHPFIWDLSLPYAMAFAGFVYPFLFVPLLLVLNWLFGSTQPGFTLAPYVVLATIPISCAITTFLGAVLSTVFWLPARALVRSPGLKVDEVRLAAHVGGWTALIGTTVFFGMMDMLSDQNTYWLAGCWVLGPGLATPLAQHVAAWTQWRANSRVVFELPRFGLYQIFVALASIAVVLTLLSLIGFFKPWAPYYVGVWLVYQWLTLHLALWVCRWRHRRRLEEGGGDAGEIKE